MYHQLYGSVGHLRFGLRNSEKILRIPYLRRGYGQMQFGLTCQAPEYIKRTPFTQGKRILYQNVPKKQQYGHSLRILIAIT